MKKMVNVICRGRQTGRTTELIKRCKEYRYALIVCPNIQMAKYIFHMAKEMGIDIPNPITFKDFVNGRFYAPHIDAFLFDNLDLCLMGCSKGALIDSVVFERNEND